MTGDRLFSVGDFAKISRTTQATLHHYGKIGLLSPMSRGENNYRYYSREQLALINVIRTLQKLGMSLAEIKRLKDRRTPEYMVEILVGQVAKIDKQIHDWVTARSLLVTLRKNIQSALNIDENAITIQFLQAEAIILGAPNDYSDNRTDYDALFSFYQTTRETHPDADLNYPVWGRFSEERVKRREWGWPDRYYFYNPAGRDERPAALYAVGHTRGGYGNSEGLYRRMLRYIDANGFEPFGCAYEEYPLNEFCVTDDANYLARVMIAVREKRIEGSAPVCRDAPAN